MKPYSIESVSLRRWRELHKILKRMCSMVVSEVRCSRLFSISVSYMKIKSKVNYVFDIINEN